MTNVKMPWLLTKVSLWRRRRRRRTYGTIRLSRCAAGKNVSIFHNKLIFCRHFSAETPYRSVKGVRNWWGCDDMSGDVFAVTVHSKYVFRFSWTCVHLALRVLPHSQSCASWLFSNEQRVEELYNINNKFYSSVWGSSLITVALIH